MTADPYMARVQRQVLDEAGHRAVSVDESERPDFTSITDSNGDEWARYSFTAPASGVVVFGPSPWLPTPEQYAAAERLLTERCRDSIDPEAALLRCWIADTKPLAVKAGWCDDDGRDYTTITDRCILADLASRAPRPSLWTRTPEWVIAGAAVVVFVLLVLSPWITS